MGDAKRRKLLNPNYGKMKVGDTYYDLKNKEELDAFMKNVTYDDMAGMAFDPEPLLFEIPKNLYYKTQEDLQKYLGFILYLMIPFFTPLYFHKQEFPDILIAKRLNKNILEFHVCVIKQFDKPTEDIEYSGVIQKAKDQIKDYYKRNEQDKGLILLYLDAGLKKIGYDCFTVSYTPYERIKEIWGLTYKSKLLAK
jgi:hypothetical protein